jgi:hypothetical protein
MYNEKERPTSENSCKKFGVKLLCNARRALSSHAQNVHNFLGTLIKTQKGSIPSCVCPKTSPKLTASDGSKCTCC